MNWNLASGVFPTLAYVGHASKAERKFAVDLQEELLEMGVPAYVDNLSVQTASQAVGEGRDLKGAAVVILVISPDFIRSAKAMDVLRQALLLTDSEDRQVIFVFRGTTQAICLGWTTDAYRGLDLAGGHQSENDLEEWTNLLHEAAGVPGLQAVEETPPAVQALVVATAEEVVECLVKLGRLAFRPARRRLAVDLYPTAPNLIGRTPVINQIKIFLQNRGSACLGVTGEAGVGKTAVVRAAAHDMYVQKWLPGGFIFPIDCRGFDGGPDGDIMEDIGSKLATILSQVKGGLPPDTQLTWASASTWLAWNTALKVLTFDNAQHLLGLPDAKEAFDAAVLHLLSNNLKKSGRRYPGLRIVIITREPEAAVHALQIIEVGRLNDASALAILRRVASEPDNPQAPGLDILAAAAQGVGGAAAQGEGVQAAIAQRCNNNPLLLLIAAALVKRQRVTFEVILEFARRVT